MTTETGLAVLMCILNASVYVGLLYIWPGYLPRDHPLTLKRRLFSTILACTVAWIPAYAWATRVRKASFPVCDLLGLRLAGLFRAIVDSLYLVVTLFAGPLVYFIYDLTPSQPRGLQPPQPLPARPRSYSPLAHFHWAKGSKGVAKGVADSGSGVDATAAQHDAAVGTGGLSQRCRSTAAKDASQTCGGYDGEVSACSDARGSMVAGGGSAAGVAAAAAAWAREKAGDLRFWRNLVVAPLTEEFVFRACMVPLLKLEGVSNMRVVLLTPLFFGAAHLHHAAELMRHQGWALGRAVGMVAFQMVYTTVFGWLATYLFLRTGHLAAPVAAHVFCNWAGFPAFGEMAAHPRGILLIITTVAGAVAFGLNLSRMTEPVRYRQEFYGGW